MLTHKQFFFLFLSSTFILLCSAIFVFVSGWQWEPLSDIPFYLYPLYLVTATGTVPQVLITCLVFTCIALLYLKPSPKKAAMYFLIIAVYLGAGQVVKETLKYIYQEPRPYVTWLQAENIISTDDFYGLTRPERAKFISEQNLSEYHIPAWLQAHWSKETGYSFPSGHTIFAAQWLMLYLMFLGRRRAVVPIVLMAVWAICMQVSRMVLGMHWASDVLVSSLLAPILIYPFYLCCRKWDLV